MILGRSFFVTPSDSVAIIAANAQQAIPYFQSGPKVRSGATFPKCLSELFDVELEGNDSFLCF